MSSFCEAQIKKLDRNCHTHNCLLRLSNQDHAALQGSTESFSLDWYISLFMLVRTRRNKNGVQLQITIKTNEQVQQVDSRTTHEG